MKITIHTENNFLQIALLDIISKIAPNKTHCRPNILILDTTSIKDIDFSEFSDLCRIIILIEDDMQSNLFLQNVISVPLSFINLQWELGFIEVKIRTIINHSDIRTGCFSFNSVPESITLQQREINILLMLGNGLSMRDISKKMKLNIKTILSYKNSALKKLFLRDNEKTTKALTFLSKLSNLSKKSIIKTNDNKCSYKKFFSVLLLLLLIEE